MGVTIVKKEEPRKIERVKITLYGDAGLGKTTLAMTSKNPLLLDFDLDHGSNRSALKADSFFIDDWKDLKNLTRNDYQGYDTIILDTVGWAVTKLAYDILEQYPSLKNNATGWFIPEGWTALRNRWLRFLNGILRLNKDVVMLAHAEEKQSKKETVIRIDSLGSAKNIIYQSSDQMGYLTKRNNKTVIDWAASSSNYGKNSAELESPMFVKSCFVDPKQMANIINLTKQRMTEKQSVMKSEAEEGEKIRLEAIEREDHDTDYFNRIYKEHNHTGGNPHIRLLIKSVAGEKGLEWDNQKQAFIIAEEQSDTAVDEGDTSDVPEPEETETPEETVKETKTAKKPAAKKPVAKKAAKGALKIGESK